MAEVGAELAAGDPVIVIEAMKMEQTLRACVIAAHQFLEAQPQCRPDAFFEIRDFLPIAILPLAEPPQAQRGVAHQL